MNVPASRRELWLLSRLNDHGIVIDAGDTTTEQRREAAYAAIEREGLAHVVVCKSKAGKPMTYAQVLPHVYPPHEGSR